MPYKAFQTADGWAIIGAGYQNIWTAFLGVIGREDLQQDPRFADLAGRVTHRDALYEILDAEVRKHRTADLLARLDAAKVPCAPVNNMEQVFAHRQVLHRGMLRPVEHPSYGTLPQIGSASKYSAFRVEEGWTAPPLLGEHSEEVLREWLGLGTVANPVFLIDELDKAPRGSQYDPLAPLHSLLEPVTASKVRDASLDIEFDASLATYIATSNDPARCPNRYALDFESFMSLLRLGPRRWKRRVSLQPLRRSISVSPGSLRLLLRSATNWPI